MRSQPTRIIAALRARLNTRGRAWLFGFVAGDRPDEVKIRYGVIRETGHFKGVFTLPRSLLDNDDPSRTEVRALIDAELTRVPA